MPFLPKSLLGSLIFYLTCVIVVTNGLFAFVSFSRENLNSFNDTFAGALFLGRVLQQPARHLLETGSATQLEEIIKSGPQRLSDLPITVYDRFWWPQWGAETRIPLSGFPDPEIWPEVEICAGQTGVSSHELFFNISSDSTHIGAIGIGIPELTTLNFSKTSVEMFLLMVVNISLAVALAAYITRAMLRPMERLIEGLQAIQLGDYSQRLNEATEGELKALEEMFNKMAATLCEKTRESTERTRLLDEKVQELWEIYSLTKEMGFSLDLRQILGHFLERAQTLSFSSYGQILIYHHQSGRLEVQVESPALPNVDQDLYHTNLATCLSEGARREVIAPQHILLFQPMLSGRKVQGVLFLAKQGNKSYSEGIRRFLETIAPLGGSLIENALLYTHVVEIRDYVRNVLNSVDSGVATIDVDGCVVTTNRAFNQLLQLTHPEDEADRTLQFEELLSSVSDQNFVQTLSDMVKSSQEQLQSVSGPGSGKEKSEQLPQKNVVSPVLAFQTALPALLPYHFAENQQKMVQVRVTPLLAGKTAIGHVIALDDQTALKNLEQQMVEAEKWAVLGRLAATVAHEIRNPLAAIRGLIEIIGEDLEGEAKQHVQVVLREVQRLNLVVQELLHLSRPPVATFRQTRLSALLEEVILLVRPVAGEEKVAIGVQYVGKEIEICVDPEKIKQAFLNIILNAVQTMSGGGELNIKMTWDTDNDQEQSSKPTFVLLEFADNGPGIDQTIAKRLFEPFFTTRGHGTGLGLTITRKLLELHGGSVDVAAAPTGQGAVFCVRLPMRPQNCDLGGVAVA